MNQLIEQVKDAISDYEALKGKSDKSFSTVMRNAVQMTLIGKYIDTSREFYMFVQNQKWKESYGDKITDIVLNKADEKNSAKYAHFMEKFNEVDMDDICKNFVPDFVVNSIK